MVTAREGNTGGGAGAVVDDADILDDEISAFDRQHALVVGFHFAFRSHEREPVDFGSVRILDFDDGLVVSVLNDASGAKEAGTIAANAELFRDWIISRWHEDLTSSVGVERRLDGIVVRDGWAGCGARCEN